MKRQKKKRLILRIFRNLICIGLFVILAALLGNAWVIGSTKGLIKKESEVKSSKADCILVLGAGVHKDNSPSLMLRDRLETACRLYEEGAASKIIMSGDHGRKDYDEVQVMKDYAIDKGIPSSDIFMDHAGFETYDTMYRAKEVFGAKKVIIVTQEYHMYRALYIADKLGLDAYGVTSDLRFYSKKMVYWKFREYFARVKSFIKCITKPEPKYLGSPIDLKASGTVTNDEE